MLLFEKIKISNYFSNYDSNNSNRFQGLIKLRWL